MRASVHLHSKQKITNAKYPSNLVYLAMTCRGYTWSGTLIWILNQCGHPETNYFLLWFCITQANANKITGTTRMQFI